MTQETISRVKADPYYIVGYLKGAGQGRGLLPDECLDLAGKLEAYLKNMKYWLNSDVKRTQ